MTITNIERNVKTIVLAIKGEYEDSVLIKKINTGSYIYYVNAVYCPIYGLRFDVNKTTKNNQKIGDTLSITKFSIYGIEYNNTVIGSIPDSVSKAIKLFLNIFNRVKIL